MIGAEDWCKVLGVSCDLHKMQTEADVERVEEMVKVVDLDLSKNEDRDRRTVVDGYWLVAVESRSRCRCDDDARGVNGRTCN